MLLLVYTGFVLFFRYNRFQAVRKLEYAYVIAELLVITRKIISAFRRYLFIVEERACIFRRVVDKIVVLNIKDHYFFMIKKAFHTGALQFVLCL